MPHGDEVAVRHWTDVRLIQSYQGFCPARCADELDFEPVGLVDVDDDPKVALLEHAIGEIPIEHDGL